MENAVNNTLIPYCLFRIQSVWGLRETISSKEVLGLCWGSLPALTLWLRGLQSDGRSLAQASEGLGHRVQNDTRTVCGLSDSAASLPSPGSPTGSLDSCHHYCAFKPSPDPGAQDQVWRATGSINKAWIPCFKAQSLTIAGLRFLPCSLLASWMPVLTFLFFMTPAQAWKPSFLHPLVRVSVLFSLASLYWGTPLPQRWPPWTTSACSCISPLQ